MIVALSRSSSKLRKPTSRDLGDAGCYFAVYNLVELMNNESRVEWPQRLIIKPYLGGV